MITEYGGWKVGDKAWTSIGVVEIVAFAKVGKDTQMACVHANDNQWVCLFTTESLQPYAKPIEVGDRVVDRNGVPGNVRYMESGEAVLAMGGVGLFIRAISSLRHATN